jgi:hypothetical protein
MHVTILTVDGEEFAHNNIATVVASNPEEGSETYFETESVLTETVHINVANVAAFVVGPNKTEAFSLVGLELDDDESEADDD